MTIRTALLIIGAAMMACFIAAELPTRQDGGPFDRPLMPTWAILLIAVLFIGAGWWLLKGRNQ